MNQRLLDAATNDKVRETVLSFSESEKQLAAAGIFPAGKMPKNQTADFHLRVMQACKPNDFTCDDFNTRISCEEVYHA